MSRGDLMVHYELYTMRTLFIMRLIVRRVCRRPDPRRRGGYQNDRRQQGGASEEDGRNFFFHIVCSFGGPGASAGRLTTASHENVESNLGVML